MNRLTELPDDAFDALAGRYVLGTMRGAARRRFQALIRYQPMLRARVAAIEEQVQPLANALPASPPSAEVWQRIQARLTPGASPASTAGEPRGSFAPLWNWFSGLALACALLLVGYISVQESPQPGPPPLYLSVMAASDQSAAQFLFCSDIRTGAVAIDALAPLQAKADTSHELWMLDADGKPISLGLMPREGRSVMRFRAESMQALASARGLAVSLEPLGGSPTGAPTGPVEYSGSLVSVWNGAADSVARNSNQLPGATVSNIIGAAHQVRPEQIRTLLESLEQRPESAVSPG